MLSSRSCISLSSISRLLVELMSSSKESDNEAQKITNEVPKVHSAGVLMLMSMFKGMGYFF